MFMNRLKHALVKPKNLYISSRFRIIDAGLLAICIIFIQYLIFIEKLDWLQTSSLVFFTIAIPFLAFHIVVTQAMEKRSFPVSAYLAKCFDATFYIGSLCTFLGISVALAHSSFIVLVVFQFSYLIVVFLVLFIYTDQEKAVERELKNLELEQDKLEIELRNLELEQHTTIETRK